MMKPGKYWIGDLCYVMHDVWDKFCEKLDECGEGTVNGKDIAWYYTAFGDGEYRDFEGCRYPVDAGLIGCILLSDITDPGADLSLGRIVTFGREFNTGYDDGTIFFGDIRIDTDPGYEEEDE